MDHAKPAPNYTTASLVMALVNLLWMLVALWAAFGLIPVLLAAVVLNHAITRIAAIRAARHIHWPRRSDDPAS